MQTRKPIILSVAALSVALAAPSTAAADKTFRGKSQQDRSVRVVTGDDNVLKSFRINWITRNCTGSGSRFQNITVFRPPFDAATPDSFSDAGALTVRDSGGIRSRVRISVSGTRTLTDPANPATEVWNGTAKATVVVRKRGKVIDRCRLRQITWNAALS